jgi:hypothetical protein
MSVYFSIIFSILLFFFYARTDEKISTTQQTMKIFNWASFNRAMHEVYIFNYITNDCRRSRNKTELMVGIDFEREEQKRKEKEEWERETNEREREKEKKEQEKEKEKQNDNKENEPAPEYYGLKSGDAEKRRSMFIPINFPSKWLAESHPQTPRLAPIVDNFVVTLLGLFVDSNEVGLVFESMRWGSLRNFMLQSKKLPAIHAYKIVLSVAKGL